MRNPGSRNSKYFWIVQYACAHVNLSLEDTINFSSILSFTSKKSLSKRRGPYLLMRLVNLLFISFSKMPNPWRNHKNNRFNHRVNKDNWFLIMQGKFFFWLLHFEPFALNFMLIFGIIGTSVSFINLSNMHHVYNIAVATLVITIVFCTKILLLLSLLLLLLLLLLFSNISLVIMHFQPGENP